MQCNDFIVVFFALFSLLLFVCTALLRETEAHFFVECKIYVVGMGLSNSLRLVSSVCGDTIRVEHFGYGET